MFTFLFHYKTDFGTAVGSPAIWLLWYRYDMDYGRVFVLLEILTTMSKHLSSGVSLHCGWQVLRKGIILSSKRRRMAAVALWPTASFLALCSWP